MSELNREFLLDQIERMSRILEYHHAEYTPVELTRHQDQITVFQMALAYLSAKEGREGAWIDAITEACQYNTERASTTAIIEYCLPKLRAKAKRRASLAEKGGVE